MTENSGKKLLVSTEKSGTHPEKKTQAALHLKRKAINLSLFDALHPEIGCKTMLRSNSTEDRAPQHTSARVLTPWGPLVTNQS